jgi:hypothetical protein
MTGKKRLHVEKGDYLLVLMDDADGLIPADDPAKHAIRFQASAPG